MKTQIRLRVFVPLLAVAIGGLAAFQLGLLDRVGLGPGQADTVAASAGGGSPGEPSTQAPATEAPAPATGETGPAATVPAPAETATANEESSATTAGTGSGAMAELESELEGHKVVVLVVYTPGSSVDALVAQEARLAAEDVGVGFVSVNAAKENQVGALALEYDLRVTPTVLVFSRGPNLENRFAGYADRATIAQAAATAKRPA